MNVTWDPARARANLSKHGVDFADAAIALEALRFKTLDMGPSLNVLFVVHAEQDEDTIRIISARKAEKAEEYTYFEGGFHE